MERIWERASDVDSGWSAGVHQRGFGATIVIGDDESDPLLGVTALESVGIEVDPRNQELRRLPFVRLRLVG